MSSTDTRTVDPAMPHHSENGGHEMSDFSWTTVLWLLPLSVIILLVFFGVCINWFKSAKDGELAHKQGMFETTELNAYHAQESEILGSYKVLDKDKGRVRIPVALAMELIAKENQGKPGKEYVPITDTYLEGAAFAVPASAKAEAEPGISIEPTADDGHGHGAAPAAHEAAKPASGQHSEKRGH